MLLPARCQNCGREREIVAMLGTSDDLVGLRTVDVPRRRPVLRQRDQVPEARVRLERELEAASKHATEGPAPAERSPARTARRAPANQPSL